MKCQGPECTNEFEPTRSTARYCSATCRQRAGRAKKAGAKAVAEEEQDDTPAEHPLVKAARRDLEKAGVIDTFDAQLALTLARRMANPDESGISAMANQLRAAMAAALGHSGHSGQPDKPNQPDPEPENDEVAEARRRRDEIAAAAAAAGE